MDCGPLTSCLQVVAAADAGLEVDRPPYTRILVLPFETHWTPPPVASPPPAPPSASAPPPSVEIDAFVNGYGVEFSWPSESQVIPVFEGWNGWTAGLPPAATRVYRFSRDAGTWTEPIPFEIRAAEYSLDGGCGGLDSTSGGAAVALQQVAEDGSVLAEAARFRCGPAETVATFGETLRLDAGRYQLAVEGATGSLEVRLVPVTAE